MRCAQWKNGYWMIDEWSAGERAKQWLDRHRSTCFPLKNNLLQFQRHVGCELYRAIISNYHFNLPQFVNNLKTNLSLKIILKKYLLSNCNTKCGYFMYLDMEYACVRLISL